MNIEKQAYEPAQMVFPIDFLTPGCYYAVRYGKYLELINGTLYELPECIKTIRDEKNFKFYYYDRKTLSVYENERCPSINELEPDEYCGLYYAHTFELRDGRCFYVEEGVRNPRWADSYAHYHIEDGKMTLLQNIAFCPDGEYIAKTYCESFKIKDGKIYILPYCIKRTEHLAPWEKYKVVDGKETKIN